MEKETAMSQESFPGRNYAVEERPDQAYRPEENSDPYIRTQCALDLYLPAGAGENAPLLVWFHGGGLEMGARNEQGHRGFGRHFAREGIGVAMAGYRLAPQVDHPVYVQDAARSVRWALDFAAESGGGRKVFVGGHSAGGYLAALLATDAAYLAAEGVELRQIAGFVPMSAQVMTHFNISKARGVKDSQLKVISDPAAPAYHLRKETPPILLLLGDNDWPARLEENMYFCAMMQKVAGNPNISLQVIVDRDHGSIAGKCAEPGDPGARAIFDFIRRWS